MRIALVLDNVLADLNLQSALWRDIAGIEGNPFLTKKILNDETFWATIRPYKDTIEVAEWFVENNCSYIILSERVKRLRYLTGNWLGRHGFNRTKVVYSTIKRFDAHVFGADYLLDVSFPDLEFYEYEKIEPILVDRENPRGLIEKLEELNG